VCRFVHPHRFSAIFVGLLTLTAFPPAEAAGEVVEVPEHGFRIDIPAGWKREEAKGFALALVKPVAPDGRGPTFLITRMEVSESARDRMIEGHRQHVLKEARYTFQPLRTIRIAGQEGKLLEGRAEVKPKQVRIYRGIFAWNGTDGYVLEWRDLAPNHVRTQGDITKLEKSFAFLQPADAEADEAPSDDAGDAGNASGAEPPQPVRMERALRHFAITAQPGWKEHREQRVPLSLMYAVPGSRAAGAMLRVYHYELEDETLDRLMKNHLAAAAAIGRFEDGPPEDVKVAGETGKLVISRGTLQRGEAMVHRSLFVRRYGHQFIVDSFLPADAYEELLPSVETMEQSMEILNVKPTTRPAPRPAPATQLATRPADPPAPTPLEPAKELKTYESADPRVRFKYPSNWETVPDENAMVTLSPAYADGTLADDTVFTLIIPPTAAGENTIAPQTHAIMAATMMVHGAADRKIVKREQTMIGGHPAGVATISGMLGGRKITVQVAYVRAVHESYYFTFIAYGDDEMLFSKQIEQLIASVEFPKPGE
jgi:hypothetical protein